MLMAYTYLQLSSEFLEPSTHVSNCLIMPRHWNMTKTTPEFLPYPSHPATRFGWEWPENVRNSYYLLLWRTVCRSENNYSERKRKKKKPGSVGEGCQRHHQVEKGAHSFLEDTVRQIRKNSLRERLKNVPGDVISHPQISGRNGSARWLFYL